MDAHQGWVLKPVPNTALNPITCNLKVGPLVTAMWVCS